MAPCGSVEPAAGWLPSSRNLAGPAGRLGDWLGYQTPRGESAQALSISFVGLLGLKNRGHSSELSYKSSTACPAGLLGIRRGETPGLGVGLWGSRVS